MKGQDILKWVLVAAAVYLLYKWAEGQGWLGGLAQPQVSPPQPQPQPQLPPPAPAPVEKPAGTAITKPTATQLHATAQAAMGPGWGGYLNVDQWNYFYQQLSGQSQTWYTQAMRTQDASKTYTAGEYVAKRAGAGLSALESWPAVSAWAN